MSEVATRFSHAPSKMTEAEFMSAFGGIYEHSPWIARAAWRQGVTERHDTPGSLASLLAAVVDGATGEQRLALIRAHPDLAGRAAVRGKLTPESTGEQAGAGIDECTPDELEQFRRLNAAYTSKFGFPFVMAVKASNRHDILAAFEQRLDNDVAAELARAIVEIHRIARLRLDALA